MKQVKNLVHNLKQLESESRILEHNRLKLAIAKGKVLLEIKESVPHGEFAKVLKAAGCSTSLRTAQREMKVAANEEFLLANTTDLSQLTLEQALQLIKQSEKPQEVKLEHKILISIKYNHHFIAEFQSYAINLLIPTEAVPALTVKKNLVQVVKDLQQLIKDIEQNPPLTDLRNIKPN